MVGFKYSLHSGMHYAVVNITQPTSPMNARKHEWCLPFTKPVSLQKVKISGRDITSGKK